MHRPFPIVNLNTHISRRRLLPLFQSEQTIADFHVGAMAIIKGEFIKTVRGGGHMLAADVTEEAIDGFFDPPWGERTHPLAALEQVLMKK